MKKKQIALLCAVFALVLLLGAVVLFWSMRYRRAGLAALFELEGAYSYNGKLLVNQNGEEAVLYQPLGNARYEVLSRKTVDLSPYGFEGKEFSYFRVSTDAGYGILYVNYYPVDSSYEPFWSVCMGDRFVYCAEDGKKYRIHPEENLCYPVFSDSIEGVDPFGQDVLAFSANATFALSLSGTDVTVYQTDPMDESLRVVKKETYSLSQYGEKATFGAFVGNTDAYFILSGEEGDRYVALSCDTGKTALSLLDQEGEYGNAVSRLYAQKNETEEEKENRLVWCHLLLGTERMSPELEGVSQKELVAVSPQGEYAVAKVTAETGEEILVMNEKRSFSLSHVLQGETVKDVVFLHENVIGVFCKSQEGKDLVRAYKICF